VDVADAGEVEAAVAEVVDQWGSIYVLVNNAGILRDAQLVKYKNGEVVSRMTDEAWEAEARFSTPPRWPVSTATSGRPTTWPPRRGSSA
jgi:NAD(P)-dependent dehydrogenase (short-subunit alcohol dehydrogenase family)